MLIEILTPDFIHSDERGCLTQLVRKGFNQINVIRSKSGSLRGGHFHKINDEAFYIVEGRILLIVESNGKTENYSFGEGDMFLIPEYVIHSFEFQEDTILVSMYTKGVELNNDEKDIFAIDIC